MSRSVGQSVRQSVTYSKTNSHLKIKRDKQSVGQKIGQSDRHAFKLVGVKIRFSAVRDYGQMDLPQL